MKGSTVKGVDDPSHFVVSWLLVLIVTKCSYIRVYFIITVYKNLPKNTFSFLLLYIIVCSPFLYVNSFLPTVILMVIESLT